MSITKKFSVFAAAVPLMAVVGCDLGMATNDTTTSTTTPANTQQTAVVPVNDASSGVVSALEYLPQCSSANQGVAIFVTALQVYYTCVDVTWIPSTAVQSGMLPQTETAPVAVSSNPVEDVSVAQPADLAPVVPVNTSLVASSGLVRPEPSVMGCFETWYGPDGVFQIETGFDNGSETSGYWFYYTDDADGGMSQIFWPAPLGNEYSELAFDAVIETCNGLCGTVALNQGTLTYDPFVGVGFLIAGTDGEGNVQVTDATAMGGIEVTYTSEVAISVEMGLSSEMDVYLGYDLPFASLPKASTVNTVRIPWSKFKQAGWGRVPMSGEEAATMLGSIKFKVQGRDGVLASFNIIAVGPYDHTCTSVSTTTPTIPETPVIPETPAVTPGTSSGVKVQNTSNFETWFGFNGEYRIETGFDAGWDNSGYWYTYADDADGGMSRITWPVERGNEYSEEAFDPVIDYCSGICGTYTLDKGTLEYDPFVGIGFFVAGQDDSGEGITTDATSMGGVCIAYTSDAAVSLEMSIGTKGDIALGYDVPYVKLPKSTIGAVRQFTWSQFEQAGWGRTKITGEEAAKSLSAIQFKIQGRTGSKGNFKILAIGPLDGGCDIALK